MGEVIVGVDESETAGRAIERAAALASALGDHLHLVMAMKAKSSGVFNFGGEEFYIDGLAPARETLNAIKKRAGVPDATIEIGEKDPAKALCTAAERRGATLIVVGNRRMQGAGRVLGAIAADVLKHAPCDVLVAHTSEDAAAEARRVSNASIFRNSSEDERKRIDQLATNIDVKAGRELATQGARGMEFGVIVNGSATVTIDGDEVATLTAGDHFGEVALMSSVGVDNHRNATVTADSDMQVAVMSISEFRALTTEFPDIAEKLRKIAIEHGAETGD